MSTGDAVTQNEYAFIVNPASAGGRTRGQWPKLQSSIEASLQNIKVFTTTKSGEATVLAQQALNEGFKVIVAVGGDGTLSEVCNAFFVDKVNKYPDAVLGCIPCGTGGDFRRTVKWDHNVDTAIERLKKRESKSIDVGHVSFTDGSKQERYFINISSCGASGLIAKISNESPKYLGGLVTFYTASVFGMLEYTRMSLRARFDDGEWEELKEVNCVAVCNGCYFGGGMKIGPDADISDGTFDITIWTNYSIIDFVTKSSAIYDGTHVQHKSTLTRKCKTVEVDLMPGQEAAKCVLELDGETPGCVPAKWTILPSAINLII